MKTIHLILVLTIAFIATSESYGQKVDFDVLPVKDFNRQIMGTSDGDKQSELIRKALATGRQDLIHACWDFGGTVSYTRNEVLKFPEGVHKDAILLMLLRTYPRMWPDPQRLRMGGGLEEYMKEPYISFIKKYLSDVTPDENLIATPALRLALADRLEAAMTGRDAPTSQAPMDMVAPLTAGTPPASSEGAKDAAISRPAAPGKESSHSLFWWLAGGVALTVLLRLAIKKRRS